MGFLNMKIEKAHLIAVGSESILSDQFCENGDYIVDVFF